jgi:hypothetical protein
VPVHRRITALLAALSTLAGGPLAASAVADADADSETSGRGARPALRAAPPDHAAAQTERASALARALGVSDERLDTVLRELRAERRATDVTGARPPVRSPSQRAAERDAYAVALAAKVGMDPSTVAAALDAPAAHPPAGGAADLATPEGARGPAAVRPPSAPGT